MINICFSAPANGTEDQDTEASRVKRGYGGGGGMYTFPSISSIIPYSPHSPVTTEITEYILNKHHIIIFSGGGGGGHGHGPG